LAKIPQNQKEDRIYRINGVFEIDKGTDENQLVFIQGLTFSLDAGIFQRDSIGTGESVFTQNGDVLGSGSFNIKNTIDMFSGTVPAVDISTLSYWLTKIAAQDPPILDIIQTLNAPKSAGNKFARILMKIRIMKPEINTDADIAVDGLVVDFEITQFTSAQRTVS
jgi:hypothetical protein